MPLKKLARDVAAKYGIDQDIYERLIDQESKFNPNAVSPRGARGLGQLMPEYYPGINHFDPEQNLNASASSLASYYKKYGNMPQALAAYNWGPGNMDKAGANWRSQIPAETQLYLQKVLGMGITDIPQQRTSQLFGVGAPGIAPVGVPQIKGPQGEPDPDTTGLPPGVIPYKYGGKTYLMQEVEDYQGNKTYKIIDEIGADKPTLTAGGKIQEQIGAAIQALQRPLTEEETREILGFSSTNKSASQTAMLPWLMGLTPAEQAKLGFDAKALADNLGLGYAKLLQDKEQSLYPWTLGMTPGQESEADYRNRALEQSGSQFDITNMRELAQMAQEASDRKDALQVQRDQLAETISNNLRNFEVAQQTLQEQMRQFNTISPYQQAQLDKMGAQLEEQKRQFEVTDARLKFESARAYDLNLKVSRFNAAQDWAKTYGRMPRGAPGFESIDAFGE